MFLGHYMLMDTRTFMFHGHYMLMDTRTQKTFMFHGHYMLMDTRTFMFHGHYIRVPSSHEWVGVQWTHSFQNKGSKWDQKESIHFISFFTFGRKSSFIGWYTCYTTQY